MGLGKSILNTVESSDDGPGTITFKLVSDKAEYDGISIMVKLRYSVSDYVVESDPFEIFMTYDEPIVVELDPTPYLDLDRLNDYELNEGDTKQVFIGQPQSAVANDTFEM